jgi:hypothetical protein
MEVKRNVRIVRVERGTFIVDGQPLAHRSALEDANKHPDSTISVSGARHGSFTTLQTVPLRVLIEKSYCRSTGPSGHS